MDIVATSAPNRTVYSSCVNAVLQAAMELGADSEEILAQVGIKPDYLFDPDKRHPLEKLIALYELAERTTTSPDIGIYAGRVDYINRINMQLYVQMVCKTFEDFLRRAPSPLRYEGDIGDYVGHRTADYVGIQWVPLDGTDNACRYLTDQMLTLAVMSIGSLSVRPIEIIETHFTYPRPANTALLQAVFGSELRFDMPVSCVRYPLKNLDRPLTQIYSSWVRPICQSVMHLFSDRYRDDQLLTRLHQILLQQLPAGDISIDSVAEALNLSRRTLQRRLAERGCVFQELLQSVRIDLSHHYLSDQQLSVTDVAMLLGYSDHASFSSAFKSWRGLSPKDYRSGIPQTLQQAGASLNDRTIPHG